MRPLPIFDPQTLVELRTAVGALDQSRKGAKPYAEIHHLATLGLKSKVFIDLDASDVLGMPMIVLRSEETCEVDALDSLSPRQREIAALVAEGLLNKQIAARLSISVGTVKDHIHNILEKAQIPNRAAIASAQSSFRS